MNKQIDLEKVKELSETIGEVTDKDRERLSKMGYNKFIGGDNKIYWSKPKEMLLEEKNLIAMLTVTEKW